MIDIQKAAHIISACLVLDRRSIFVDIETTGLDPEKDRIIQFSAVVLEKDGRHDLMNFYINPGQEISPEAQAVNKIDGKDLLHHPPFSQIAVRLYDILKECDIYTWNGSKFDIKFLAAEFNRCGIDWPVSERLIDIKQIHYKLHPNNLSAAYKQYTGQELIGAHDATADASAAMNVLAGMLMKLDVWHAEQLAVMSERKYHG